MSMEEGLAEGHAPILRIQRRRDHRLGLPSRGWQNAGICDIVSLASFRSEAKCSLPGINQPRLIDCSPTKVPYTLHIRSLFVKLLHALQSEGLESLSGASSIGEKVDHGEKLGQASRADGTEEVIGKGGAAVGCGDSCDGENLECSLGKVGCEVPAVETSLDFSVSSGNVDISAWTHHAMSDEVNSPAWVDGGYFLFKDFGAVDGAGGCGHTGDEDFCTVLLENLFDTTPVGDFEGSYGRAYGNAVEAKKAMAEYDGILGWFI